MDSTLFIIGIIGNIISVLVFISPIKTFWRIVRCGSTEEFEPAPYVFTLLNALLWLYYGVTKPDGILVATVNGFGAVMEAIYVVLFLVYADDHATRAKTAKLAAALDIGVFGVVFAATTFAIRELDLRIMVIGVMCAFLNVFMYGSPLAAMKTVITTKSVEYMPFFLSFFLFLNGGVWAVYAILDRDIFLGRTDPIGSGSRRGIGGTEDGRRIGGAGGGRPADRRRGGRPARRTASDGRRGSGRRGLGRRPVVGGSGRQAQAAGAARVGGRPEVGAEDGPAGGGDAEAGAEAGRRRGEARGSGGGRRGDRDGGGAEASDGGGGGGGAGRPAAARNPRSQME